MNWAKLLASGLRKKVPANFAALLAVLCNQYMIVSLTGLLEIWVSNFGTGQNSATILGKRLAN